MPSSTEIATRSLTGGPASPCVSRTASRRPRPGSTVRSANRAVPSAVSGAGAPVPTWAWTRPSSKSENQTRSPETAYAPPPYSCTRDRTLNGGGRDIPGPPGCVGANEDVASSLAWTSFEPADATGVQADRREPDRLRDDGVGGDRGGPSAEGKCIHSLREQDVLFGRRREPYRGGRHASVRSCREDFCRAPPPRASIVPPDPFPPTLPGAHESSPSARPGPEDLPGAGCSGFRPRDRPVLRAEAAVPSV